MKHSFCLIRGPPPIGSHQGPSSPWNSRRVFYALNHRAVQTENIRLESIDAAVPDGRRSSSSLVFKYPVRPAYYRHASSTRGYGREHGFYVDAYGHGLL